MARLREEVKVGGLAVAGLTFGYGDSLLFSDFSLQSSASTIVLKGPSGSGKTTLLKILFGSIQSKSALVLPSTKGAALILQQDALFPWLSGRANIRLFTECSKSQIESHSLFHLVSDFVDRRAYAMSYGQRRAIELFRVLLLRPNILYMDEPFNYLDDRKAQAFIKYLSQGHGSKLLVVTTHRNDVALDEAADTFYFSGHTPYHELERK
jgi:ABC-type multidrug transport system ATPase subunit